MHAFDDFDGSGFLPGGWVGFVGGLAWCFSPFFFLNWDYNVDFFLVEGKGSDFVEEHGEDTAAGFEVEFWVTDGDVDSALECFVCCRGQ